MKIELIQLQSVQILYIIKYYINSYTSKLINFEQYT